MIWPMDDDQTRLCGARYQCASYTGDDLDDLPEEKKEVVTIMSNHATTCGANFWDDTKLGPYRFIKDKSSWDLGVKGNVKDLQEEVSLGELQMDENNFDGIFVALLTCFATMTLEGWTITMYMVQDAVTESGGAFFFYGNTRLAVADVRSSFVFVVSKIPSGSCRPGFDAPLTCRGRVHVPGKIIDRWGAAGFNRSKGYGILRCF